MTRKRPNENAIEPNPAPGPAVECDILQGSSYPSGRQTPPPRVSRAFFSIISSMIIASTDPPDGRYAAIDHVIETHSLLELGHFLGFGLGHGTDGHDGASGGLDDGQIEGPDTLGDVDYLQFIQSDEGAQYREAEIALLRADVHERLGGDLSEGVPHDDSGSSDALGETFGHVLHGPLAEYALVVGIGLLGDDLLIGPVIGDVHGKLLPGVPLELLRYHLDLLEILRIAVPAVVHVEQHDVRSDP